MHDEVSEEFIDWSCSSSSSSFSYSSSSSSSSLLTLDATAVLRMPVGHTQEVQHLLFSIITDTMKVILGVFINTRHHHHHHHVRLWFDRFVGFFSISPSTCYRSGVSLSVSVFVCLSVFLFLSVCVCLCVCLSALSTNVSDIYNYLCLRCI